MVKIKKSYSTVSYLYCLLGGFLFALGFPNPITTVLIPAPIIGIYILINRNTFFRNGRVPYSLKRDFAFLFCFALSAYFSGYYWLPYTISEFGSIPFPFDQLLGLCYSLIIFPQFIAFLLILKLLKKYESKLPFITQDHVYFNLFFASLLTFLELVTPQLFETHLGHAWLSIAPYLGPAPIFGKAIYSFVTYYFIFFILKLKNEEKIEFLPISVFIIFLLVNFLNPINYDKSHPKKLNLRIVQGNVGNYIKVSSEKGGFQSLSNVLQRYHDLSTKESKDDIDLIIWPETSYPTLLSSQILKSKPESISPYFKTIMNSQNADLFFGGYDSTRFNGLDTGDFETDYNTAFLLREEDEIIWLDNFYHKVKLLPFGESLPFGPLNPYLSKFITNISYFKKGERYTLFNTKKEAMFIASICYEILNPSFTRKYLNANSVEPHFIINLTNDSWYGESIEPYQHLYLGHWRAVEFNIPIVRSTNTGISSVLYPDGSESKRTALFEQEYLDISLPIIDRDKTIYQRFGHLPLIIFIFLLGLMIYVKHWIILKRKKN